MTSLDLRRPLPLYLQMADDISARIQAGEFKIGSRLGSHRELSKEYAISLMTVKKALSHLAQQGWIYTRVGIGSFVTRSTPAGPGDATPANRSIGVVLENLQSPFFSVIVQSVEGCAYRNGYNVLLSTSLGESEKEERQIRHFRRIGVNGLVIASLHHLYHANPTIQMLHREHFPFVMVSFMDDPAIPFVGTDHEQGAYMATRHLGRLGYQRIGYLNAERGNLVGELRKNGYARALRDIGRDPDPRFQYRIRVHGVRDYLAGGYEIGREFLRPGRPHPDAMFIYNDSAALGFERAVLELGLRVPDDVAIVGFDNIDQGRYAAVPLTTIEQPVVQIGSEAVNILIRKIEGRMGRVRKVFKPELVIRHSCGYRSPTKHHAAETV